MEIPDRFTLTVETEQRLWIVTSPEIKGLFVAKHSMKDAIEATAKALGDLLLADAH